MADPCSIVPYHDPHDSPIDYEFLNFIIDSNPNLAELPSIDEPNNANRSNDNIAAPSHPFDDPVVWSICNESNTTGRQSQGAGPSQSQNRTEAGSSKPPRYSDDGMPISAWPPPTAPYTCTCCQVLREIIHTDGSSTTKLEIHGRLGIICHAIAESRDYVPEFTSEPKYHMLDFCKKSIVHVKQFLKQYCDDKKKAGYVMVQDPLSIFYEALCVGIEWDENLNNDDFSDPSPSFSEPRQADQMELGGNETERASRSSLAQQRERAGKLTLKDFEPYFHLPIEKAARRMNLCPTVVKKICRRDGLTRWPHRKIKSMQRQISNITASVNSIDPEERRHAQAEIQRLQEEISRICSGATTN